VRGEGTRFTAINSAAGRWFHVRGGRPYGTWLPIQSVVSDTELILKTPATLSVSGEPWWWEDDWRSGTCGFFVVRFPSRLHSRGVYSRGSNHRRGARRSGGYSNSRSQRGRLSTKRSFLRQARQSRLGQSSPNRW
jgi:hypothetical protein